MDVTVIRTDRVYIYLSGNDDEHFCIGAGATDDLALADAVHTLEESLKNVRDALALSVL